MPQHVKTRHIGEIIGGHHIQAHRVEACRHPRGCALGVEQTGELIWKSRARACVKSLGIGRSQHAISRQRKTRIPVAWRIVGTAHQLRGKRSVGSDNPRHQIHRIRASVRAGSHAQVDRGAVGDCGADIEGGLPILVVVHEKRGAVHCDEAVRQTRVRAVEASGNAHRARKRWFAANSHRVASHRRCQSTDARMHPLRTHHG